jgi:ribose 5-phosphate isomerase A
MDNSTDAKKQSALQALPYVESADIIGMGTGSTVECLLDLLAQMPWAQKKHYVVSSVRTQNALIARGFNTMLPNEVQQVPVYIDGADWIDNRGIAIKGYGGAMFREKLIARMALRRVAIVTPAKIVPAVSAHTQPIPLEVIEASRSYVARYLIKQGARVVYREGMRTDQGNPILDLYDWHWEDPIAAERALKEIIGVVESGLFAQDYFHHVLS